CQYFSESLGKTPAAYGNYRESGERKGIRNPAQRLQRSPRLDFGNASGVFIQLIWEGLRRPGPEYQRSSGKPARASEIYTTAQTRHDQHSRNVGLAFVDYHDPALDYHFRLQPVPIAFPWIAVEKNKIGELTRIQRSQLVSHLDVGGRIRPHHLDQVLRREHHIEDLQLVIEPSFRIVGRIGAVAENGACIPDRPRIHRH